MPNTKSKTATGEKRIFFTEDQLAKRWGVSKKKHGGSVAIDSAVSSYIPILSD